MDFWIAAVGLVLAVVGMIFLWRQKRQTTKKSLCTIGMVLLGCAAAAAFGYLVLTILLAGGIS